MDSLYYKNLAHTRDGQREKLIKLAIDYIDKNRYVNPETGQIYENYPSALRDFRKWRAQKKIENPNSYSNRLFSSLGENAYWYTCILGDVFPSWAKYQNIFNPTQVKKIKAHFNRVIKGPFSGHLEVSGFTGAHIHIISGKQTYKHLKAETDVYRIPGLVKYTSKSCVSDKDKETEEYMVMAGEYLSWKGKIGSRRLPRRSWTRLKCEC